VKGNIACRSRPNITKGFQESTVRVREFDRGRCRNGLNRIWRLVEQIDAIEYHGLWSFHAVWYSGSELPKNFGIIDMPQHLGLYERGGAGVEGVRIRMVSVTDSVNNGFTAVAFVGHFGRSRAVTLISAQ